MHPERRLFPEDFSVPRQILAPPIMSFTGTFTCRHSELDGPFPGTNPLTFGETNTAQRSRLSSPASPGMRSAGSGWEFCAGYPALGPRKVCVLWNPIARSASFSGWRQGTCGTSGWLSGAQLSSHLLMFSSGFSSCMTSAVCFMSFYPHGSLMGASITAHLLQMEQGEKTATNLTEREAQSHEVSPYALRLGSGVCVCVCSL